jgi:hypothetical protein
MLCILSQDQWKAIKILVQAKLLAKATKKKLKSSTGGEFALRKKVKSTNAPLSVGGPVQVFLPIVFFPAGNLNF